MGRKVWSLPSIREKLKDGAHGTEEHDLCSEGRREDACHFLNPALSEVEGEMPLETLKGRKAR